MKKTVCELFAGVGGFRLGLERASPSWKTVWFSQWEPGAKNQWAHDCYVKHFGDIDLFTGVDIATVDKKYIPTHNLLVGGFPCQDYSVARPLPGATGIEGIKGVLWWQINEILKEKNTPFVLLENVDRLLKSPAKQRGRDFGVMLTCLNNLGYSVEWRVVNAADYGAAQKRRRTFIFAYKRDTRYSEKIRDKTAEIIISKKGFFARTFPVSRPSLADFKKVKFTSEYPWEISDSFTYKFENAGYMSDGEITTVAVSPIVEDSIKLKDILDTNVGNEYYLGHDIDDWKYLKSSKKITRISKTGFKYDYSEGAIPFPDSLDSPARTLLTSESSKSRSSHVIEDPETKQLRKLTPIETERIQGFDDNWTNTGMPKSMRYFCMGNALVVPMVTRMGLTLNIIFKNE